MSFKDPARHLNGSRMTNVSERLECGAVSATISRTLSSSAAGT